MTTYTQIETALNNKLLAVPNMYSGTFGNNKFKPTVGTPWFRATNLIAEPQASSIGVIGQDELIGIYNINLFYQIGGIDDAMIEAVLAAFNRGTFITAGTGSVHILRSWKEVIREEPTWTQVPIYARWNCYNR